VTTTTWQETIDRASLDQAHREYAKTGSRVLRDRLVLSHLPLARHLAKRFAPRGGQTQDDVNQAAYIGLIKSVDGFDPSRGFRFSTYATTTILGELKRNLRDHGWVMRPSRRSHDLYLEMESTLEDLTHELGRAPTIPELAARAGVAVEDVLVARELAERRVVASLDGPRPSRQKALSETIGGEDDNLRRVEERVTITSALGVLSEEERTVVRMRFGESMTQAAIAREIGWSQMRVSRMLSRTLAALRERLDEPEAPRSSSGIRAREASPSRLLLCAPTASRHGTGEYASEL
jgi:RNA polymerase sigma-B factor